MNLGLGRLQAVDTRNALHPMMRMLPEIAPPNLPVSKAWPFDQPSLNQGDTGTCTAHAAVHFMMCGPWKHKASVLVNPYTLYREIVLLDEYPQNDHEALVVENFNLRMGSSGTGAAKALHRRNLITEYLWAGRFEDAINWILLRGPLMIGTNWYSSMYDGTPEGFLQIKSGARLDGGHEWVLRSWNRKKAYGEAINSWGPSWNAGRSKVKGGRFLIDEETLRRLFHEDGDAVSAIEKH
jgi:hypothetical protein